MVFLALAGEFVQDFPVLPQGKPEGQSAENLSSFTCPDLLCLGPELPCQGRSNRLKAINYPLHSLTL